MMRNELKKTLQRMREPASNDMNALFLKAAEQDEQKRQRQIDAQIDRAIDAAGEILPVTKTAGYKILQNLKG